MDFKNRNVSFYGLMTVFILLFSISMCGCTIIIRDCCQGKADKKDTQGRPTWGTGRFVGAVKNKDTGAWLSGATLVFDGPQDASDVSDPGYSTGWIVSGTYDITVSKPGFPTINDNDVVLHTDETRSKIYYLDPTP